jgi:hypothetical protein
MVRGKDTASAMPPRPAKNAGFSPWDNSQFTASVHYEIASKIIESGID